MFVFVFMYQCQFYLSLFEILFASCFSAAIFHLGNCCMSLFIRLIAFVSSCAVITAVSTGISVGLLEQVG